MDAAVAHGIAITHKSPRILFIYLLFFFFLNFSIRTRVYHCCGFGLAPTKLPAEERVSQW